MSSKAISSADKIHLPSKTRLNKNGRPRIQTTGRIGFVFREKNVFSEFQDDNVIFSNFPFKISHKGSGKRGLLMSQADYYKMIKSMMADNVSASVETMTTSSTKIIELNRNRAPRGKIFFHKSGISRFVEVNHRKSHKRASSNNAVVAASSTQPGIAGEKVSNTDESIEKMNSEQDPIVSVQLSEPTSTAIKLRPRLVLRTSSTTVHTCLKQLVSRNRFLLQKRNDHQLGDDVPRRSRKFVELKQLIASSGSAQTSRCVEKTMPSLCHETEDKIVAQASIRQKDQSIGLQMFLSDLSADGMAGARNKTPECETEPPNKTLFYPPGFSTTSTDFKTAMVGESTEKLDQNFQEKEASLIFENSGVALQAGDDTGFTPNHEKPSRLELKRVSDEKTKIRIFDHFLKCKMAQHFCLTELVLPKISKSGWNETEFLNYQLKPFHGEFDSIYQSPNGGSNPVEMVINHDYSNGIVDQFVDYEIIPLADSKGNSNLQMLLKTGRKKINRRKSIGDQEEHNKLTSQTILERRLRKRMVLRFRNLRSTKNDHGNNKSWSPGQDTSIKPGSQKAIHPKNFIRSSCLEQNSSKIKHDAERNKQSYIREIFRPIKFSNSKHKTTKSILRDHSVNVESQVNCEKIARTSIRWRETQPNSTSGKAPHPGKKSVSHLGKKYSHLVSIVSAKVKTSSIQTPKSRSPRNRPTWPKRCLRPKPTPGHAEKKKVAEFDLSANNIKAKNFPRRKESSSNKKNIGRPVKNRPVKIDRAPVVTRGNSQSRPKRVSLRGTATNLLVMSALITHSFESPPLSHFVFGVSQPNVLDNFHTAQRNIKTAHEMEILQSSIISKVVGLFLQPPKRVFLGTKMSLGIESGSSLLHTAQKFGNRDDENLLAYRLTGRRESSASTSCKAQRKKKSKLWLTITNLLTKSRRKLNIHKKSENKHSFHHF